MCTDTDQANNVRLHQCCVSIDNFPSDLNYIACDYKMLSEIFANVGVEGENQPTLIVNNSALADAKIRNAYFQCLTNGKDQTGCCETLHGKDDGIRE